jgi:hypothetical protein
VAQASANALNTRNRLAAICSVSVELAKPSLATETNFANTACGDGRNSGLTQCMPVIRNQPATSTATVTMLIARLLP